ncbi:unnamed protein product [Phaeothamnion confervicola]
MAGMITGGAAPSLRRTDLASTLVAETAGGTPAGPAASPAPLQAAGVPQRQRVSADTDTAAAQLASLSIGGIDGGYSGGGNSAGGGASDAQPRAPGPLGVTLRTAAVNVYTVGQGGGYHAGFANGAYKPPPPPPPPSLPFGR